MPFYSLYNPSAVEIDYSPQIEGHAARARKYTRSQSEMNHVTVAHSLLLLIAYHERGFEKHENNN